MFSEAKEAPIMKDKTPKDDVGKEVHRIKKEKSHITSTPIKGALTYGEVVVLG